MAQQTAVEWLVKELSQELDYIPIKQWDRIRDLVEQAKRIEREQIIEAWDKACTDQDRIGREYYEQTYVNNA